MDLEGHSHITRIAIEELKVTSNSHPYVVALNKDEIRRFVVLRDLEDISNFGHWRIGSKEHQKHHFMRANGQSQYEAYNSGLNWIKENAKKAIKSFQLFVNSTKIKMPKNKSSYELPNVFSDKRFSFGKQTPYIYKINSSAINSTPLGLFGNTKDYALNAITPYTEDLFLMGAMGILIYAEVLNILGVNIPMILADKVNPALKFKGWKHLGYALHALQDSFAEAHIKREKDKHQYSGKIQWILMYAGKEKEGHAELDTKWKKPNKDLSISGWAAVEASKDLIHAILFSVITGYDFDLLFKSFTGKHLAVSPSLKEKWHIKQVRRTGITIPISDSLFPPIFIK